MNNVQPKVYEIAHIRQIAGVMAIQDMIKSYAFYDQETKTFREKMAEKLHPVAQLIKYAFSRANGFGPLDLDENTDDPHWVYNADNDRVCMQAVNCPICGEYQAYDSVYDYNIPHCNFDYETFGLDRDAHFAQANEEAHNINMMANDDEFEYDSYDEDEEDYDY